MSGALNSALHTNADRNSRRLPPAARPAARAAAGPLPHDQLLLGLLIPQERLIGLVDLGGGGGSQRVCVKACM